MKNQNVKFLPWPQFFSELVGAALLVLVGLSLVIVMFGSGSPVARVLPGEGLTAEQTLMYEFTRLPRDAALLPVVPEVTDSFALMLASMKESGFNVTVFLIDNNRQYETTAALLARHEINLIHIEHERNLHELSPAKIGH